MIMQDGMASPAVKDTARLAIAGLIGLAVGIEREWSGHASGPHARFAGVRTFLMLGMLGGAAGLLASWGYVAVAVALLGGGALFVAIAYFMAARRDADDIDGTTEGAALVVLALGMFAGVGRMALAAGAVTIVVIALREKEGLHTLVGHIGKTEMRATLQFAVLALVVLPLLPSGTYGPLGGVRPRALWTIVLVLAGLNFVGYIARRTIGPARGYTLTGMLGGMVSSTMVTFQFARMSRTAHQDGAVLARGVVAACTVLLPRVAIITWVLSPALGAAVLPYLIPPFLTGALLTLVALRAPSGSPVATEEEKNPLALGSALRMAVFFQLAIVLIAVMHQYWGSAGVLATSAVMGATDMDALTVSMARLGESSQAVSLAARGLGAGVLSNTVFKLATALVLGSSSFRRHAGLGLFALAIASAFGLWFGVNH
jgi:uncharacterized membrane protein (DUF4010 family)